MLAQLDHALESIAVIPETIYLGGGTPSALSNTHLDVLLSGIAQRLDLSGLQEWDLEANPATFGKDKAELMRERGVTRISLGVQSWDPQTLQTLGRDHSPEQAEAAFEILRAAGFNSLNIDLMFSIPGQRSEQWRADLEQTIALRPDHISAYNLNYEEDTEFFERLQTGEFTDKEDRNAEMFQISTELLSSAGFEHYEISNFATAGQQSRHNAAYWAGADYLGLGPGAFSTINSERWRNLPDTAGYIAATEAGEFRKLVTEHESLDAEAFRKERIALELRTAKGLERRHLPSPDAADDLIERGLLEPRGERIALTEAGKLLADPIAAELI